MNPSLTGSRTIEILGDIAQTSENTESDWRREIAIAPSEQGFKLNPAITHE
ncbi:MAG TPA: hypothetical protein IGS52_05805 [Oscillatoriaceae cyanobacterium M33_DOE_052]|nr:hypothetical protein [Oscillatoriaceae cyanobacterium M33_DOE_052]